MNEAGTKTELIGDVNPRNLKVKLYKFRSLANDQDFKRLKGILETGEFWCSKFSEFNDPREGGFTTFKVENINEIYEKKESYKICSFSAKKAFSNPLMWGYYANGFKGVAIEVKVNDSEIEKVAYVEDIPNLETLNNKDKKANLILTTKSRPWKHECEYRFLKKSSGNNNKFKIGKIIAIYFGDPYEGAYNKDEIYENTETLKCYKQLKGSTLDYIKANKKLKYFKLYSVKIENCKVIKNEDLKKTVLNSERS